MSRRRRPSRLSCAEPQVGNPRNLAEEDRDDRREAGLMHAWFMVVGKEGKASNKGRERGSLGYWDLRFVFYKGQ